MQERLYYKTVWTRIPQWMVSELERNVRYIRQRMDTAGIYLLEGEDEMAAKTYEEASGWEKNIMSLMNEIRQNTWGGV